MKYPDICPTCPVDANSLCDPDRCKDSRENLSSMIIGDTAAIEDNSSVKNEEITEHKLNALAKLSVKLSEVNEKIALKEAKC